MRLLHIASFKGNIGDIVNHKGFYTQLYRASYELGVNLEIDQIEIRRFYRNSGDLLFDKKMLDKINSYDGLIIGGGGYFDIYWDYSDSGTTLNMSDSFIDNIKIPVLVNAIGVHIDYDCDEAINKFKSFFEHICNKNDWKIRLRNDGSLNRLKSIVKNIPVGVESVPDNGFVFEREFEQHENTQKSNSYESSVEKRNNTIGLSITNDLFNNHFNGTVSTHKFNDSVVRVCNYIIQKGNDIMFFLHTPQDIEVLYYLYSRLEKSLFRNRIRIAPYDTYDSSNAKTFDYLYSNCRYVIAMRFHANVIAIKNNTPVIGLAGHEQIKGLYDEIGLSEQCVVVRDGFEEKLLSMIDDIDANLFTYSLRERDSMQRISSQYSSYYSLISSWLSEVNNNL